jgi:hypothetical protein
VLVAGAIAALVVGLEDVGSARPDAVVAGAGLGGGALLLAAAVAHLVRAPRPLVDLQILRITTFRVTALAGSGYRAAITAIPFLLVLFFQLGFGWSAARAGLVVIALFVGNVGIKPATTTLLRRFGIRPVMLGAIVAGALCLLAVALLQPTTPLPVVLVLLLLSGVARSIGFTAYNTVAFADVPGERMSPANTLLSTLQELGGGLGIAVAALLVRLGEPLSASAGLGTGTGAAFRVAFVLLAVFLLVPLVAAVRLPRAAGSVVTGRSG